jgi:hypothetical protein
MGISTGIQEFDLYLSWRLGLCQEKWPALLDMGTPGSRLEKLPGDQLDCLPEVHIAHMQSTQKYIFVVETWYAADSHMLT